MRARVIVIGILAALVAGCAKKTTSRDAGTHGGKNSTAASQGKDAGRRDAGSRADASGATAALDFFVTSAGRLYCFAVD